MTHLPPFMGILFGLGILWLVGDLVHRHKEDEFRDPLHLGSRPEQDRPQLLVFFIGILLAVATLEHSHILGALAVARPDDRPTGTHHPRDRNRQRHRRQRPLVAASMGMYDLARFPADSLLWQFLAYCAGTGVDPDHRFRRRRGGHGPRRCFFWYVRKISWLASSASTLPGQGLPSPERAPA